MCQGYEEYYTSDSNTYFIIENNDIILNCKEDKDMIFLVQRPLSPIDSSFRVP